MKAVTMVFVLLSVLTLGVVEGISQTFDAQFVVMTNNGTNYDVKVQIKANGSAFPLGTSNLIFSFDGTALSNPTLHTAHNYSGTSYQTMGLTGTGTSRSISIELNTAGTGSNVPTAYTDVATIRFTVLDQAGSANLRWNSGATVVYKDDETTVVDPGTLNNLDTSPLPVQLGSFSANTGQQNGEVVVKWATVSEVNNYGFTLQRKGASEQVFSDLSGAFIAGKGTTIEPQSYSFVDRIVDNAGTYNYRLKQQDLDGSVHYSQSVQVSVLLTAVAETAPKAFQLLQNYPNPFNPSTRIRFSVKSTGPATLTVYNTLGELVTTLFEETAEAGRYYIVSFNGAGLSSGMYFYRLTSGEGTDIKRLALVK